MLARAIPQGASLRRARSWAGLSWSVRVRLQVERDQLIDQLARLDAALLVLAGERLGILAVLDGLRDDLWPVLPEWNGRRPPIGDAPPLAPAHPEARPLQGYQLRRACLGVLRRHGELDLRELHSLLHHHGYVIAGSHPVKTLADAMGYETRCDRAERVRRGRYRIGIAPDAGERPGDPPLTGDDSPGEATEPAPSAVSEDETGRVSGATPAVAAYLAERASGAPDLDLEPPTTSGSASPVEAPSQPAGPRDATSPVAAGLPPVGFDGVLSAAPLPPVGPHGVLSPAGLPPVGPPPSSPMGALASVDVPSRPGGPPPSASSPSSLPVGAVSPADASSRTGDPASVAAGAAASAGPVSLDRPPPTRAPGPPTPSAGERSGRGDDDGPAAADPTPPGAPRPAPTSRAVPGTRSGRASASKSAAALVRAALEPRGLADPCDRATLRPFRPSWHEGRRSAHRAVAAAAPPIDARWQRDGPDPDVALDPPAHADRRGFRPPGGP